jgi:hypothetical protein
MKAVRWNCLLALVALGAAFPAYAANLIINGSFESGNFVPNAQNTMVLAIGDTDIAGWTVQNASLAWIGPSNPFGLTASDGSYFLDLSGYHDSAPYGGVLQSQTIATTIGAQYRVTFDIGTDPQYDSAPVGVQVTAGSSSALFTSTPLNPNQWETFNFDFTATSTATSLSLVGQAGTDEKYVGLDNVSFREVPEPGTLALLAGPGLLVFAAWRRCRKS